MIQALLTAAEICPVRSAQCLDLIKHIELGDAAVFTEKAKQLISRILDEEPSMTREQRETLLEAVK